MSRRHVLVTYDIADDKRRTKTFDFLSGIGDHLQFSVFLCELNQRERAEMQGILQALIHHRKDQVILLDLGSADHPIEVGSAMECIGKAYHPQTRAQVI